MSGDIKVCDIPSDLKEEIRKFRFRKSETNAALILKVDRESLSIRTDELIEDVKLDDLQDQLHEHQPRYIIYSFKHEHKDGRVSFPMCFIFYTPRDSQMELQVMYAGTKLALQKEAELTRVYEIRELDELTEEWLLSKLEKCSRVIQNTMVIEGLVCNKLALKRFTVLTCAKNIWTGLNLHEDCAMHNLDKLGCKNCMNV